ncbi:hypothetical protein UFOVP1596_27 [uncultured Caudovirales phage]|uniref:Uncharacterized protein n=1 Tax=uncultured Caudovirales phage TaxID=2100421 RepID=A0A6J5STE0_9CAUD|nr:hypothetical protein UFOVP1596_27 [uncultured Caudovirales phage]
MKTEEKYTKVEVDLEDRTDMIRLLKETEFFKDTDFGGTGTLQLRAWCKNEIEKIKK